MPTKGEWIIEEDKLGDIKIISDQTEPDDTLDVAEIDNYKENAGEARANAHLIVSAVNACISVNPDNPLAVAESIIELVKTLKSAQAYIAKVEMAKSTIRTDLEMRMINVLAKVESKSIEIRRETRMEKTEIWLSDKEITLLKAAPDMEQAIRDIIADFNDHNFAGHVTQASINKAIKALSKVGENNDS